MSREHTASERRDRQAGSFGFAGAPCCPEGVTGSRAGDNMAQRMRTCPCTGWVGRHRLAAYTALAVVGLGALALPVGWVLGIIAFFRTL